jgi:glyceraldehyde-3-phosphate dehydrogenase/erythrose-4-phosphate dehydrogenase
MWARGDEFEIVAVNDLTDNKMLSTLLQYDSTHRRFNGTVGYDDKHLIVDGKKIQVFEVRNPAELPWGDLGVYLLLEPAMAKQVTTRILRRGPRRSCLALLLKTVPILLVSLVSMMTS